MRNEQFTVAIAALAATAGTNIAAQHSDVSAAFSHIFENFDALTEVLILFGHGYNIEVAYIEREAGNSFVVTVLDSKTALYDCKQGGIGVAIYSFTSELEAHDAAFAVHRALVANDPHLLVAA